jgi:hypothetical protein
MNFGALYLKGGPFSTIALLHLETVNQELATRKNPQRIQDG